MTIEPLDDKHLDEIEKLAEAQEFLRVGAYALPLVKAVREARADAARHKEESWAWTCVAYEWAKERNEAREQKLAAEQRFDTMEAEYLKACRESMEAQDSLRQMRVAAANFEKAWTLEVEAHTKAQAEVERLNRDMQFHDCTHRDTPGLIHCPIDKPCSLHRIKLLELKLQRIKELA